MPLDFSGMKELNRGPSRRNEEAMELLALIRQETCAEKMTDLDAKFYGEMVEHSEEVGFTFSEGQVCWLRDLAGRYA
jgi:hypothetical protein